MSALKTPSNGNIPDGVQAIKNGAFDYITKGDDNNKILPLLSRATEKAQMQRRLARLEGSAFCIFTFRMYSFVESPVSAFIFR